MKQSSWSDQGWRPVESTVGVRPQQALNNQVAASSLHADWVEYYQNVLKWADYHAKRKEPCPEDIANLVPHARFFLRQWGLLESVSAPTPTPAPAPAPAPTPIPAPAPAPAHQNAVPISVRKEVRPETSESTNNRGGGVNWPPALKTYVENAYSECKTAEDRAVVDQVLKETIATNLSTGMLWKRDWANEESPLVKAQAKLQQERQQQANVDVQFKLKKRRKRVWEDAKESIAAIKTDFNQNAVENQEERPEFKGKFSSSSSSSSSWAKFVYPEEKKNGEFERFDGNKSVGGDSWKEDCYGKRRRKAGRRNLTSPSNSSMVSTEEEDPEKLAKRRARFDKFKLTSPVGKYDPDAVKRQARRVGQALQQAEDLGLEIDLSKFVVRGTSTALEKKYLRLTDVPDPSLIRPEPILQKALDMVENRWARSLLNKNRDPNLEKDLENPGVTYLWTCEQMKSIRQDLTVQHIKNQFTARVYESHARMALREADLKEFNQCMTQLQELYEEPGIGDTKVKNEFTGYKVLYLVYIHLKYNQPNTHLITLLASMPKDRLQSINVQHALAIRSAVERGLYGTYFKLSKSVPDMGIHLVKLLDDYVRHNALGALCKTFKPTLPVQVIQKTLHIDDWKKFIAAYEAKVNVLVHSDGSQLLDTKLSLPAFNVHFQWPVLDGDSVQHQ